MGKAQLLVGILQKQRQDFTMATKLRAQQELWSRSLWPSPVLSKSCVKFLRLDR